MIALLIAVSLSINLGVFVSYPMSGPMGFTFLYISAVLWCAFGILIGHATARISAWGKTVLALIFAMMCAFSGLSFLPQADKVSAIRKFSDGNYPDRRSVYLGLLRLGIDIQPLRPPQTPQEEVI